MDSVLRKAQWSPYLVGAGIGLLLTVLLLFSYKIGVSTGIAHIAALFSHLFSPRDSLQTPYFAKLLSSRVVFPWSVLFVFGLIGGAFASARLSKSSPPDNSIWIQRFGASHVKRYTAAFIGGVFLMLGARIANGCTSGHAISGGAQLALTSWVFMGSLFASAIPTAFILYRKKRV